MRRFCFLLCFTIVSYAMNGQTVTRYFDEEWNPVVKEKAKFYADFKKEGSFYQCTSYYLKTGSIQGKSTYPDTVLAKPQGLAVLYYESGTLQDSSLFDGASNFIYSYHYFPNKKLSASYVAQVNKEPIIEGYDEAGNRIKNYIFGKEAEFKGGEKKWIEYLGKNLSADFSSSTNQEQTVNVRVLFIVNETGQVIRPKVVESSGIKAIDADAIRVLLSSPSWIAAIQFNKAIKVYRIQPITYVLHPRKKGR